jgi:hypothetical protein
VAERGGFEPPVSREVFPKENTRECWDILGRNPLGVCPSNQELELLAYAIAGYVHL